MKSRYRVLSQIKRCHYNRKSASIPIRASLDTSEIPSRDFLWLLLLSGTVIERVKCTTAVGIKSLCTHISTTSAQRLNNIEESYAMIALCEFELSPSCATWISVDYCNT